MTRIEEFGTPIFLLILIMHEIMYYIDGLLLIILSIKYNKLYIMRWG